MHFSCTNYGPIVKIFNVLYSLWYTSGPAKRIWGYHHTFKRYRGAKLVTPKVIFVQLQKPTLPFYIFNFNFFKSIIGIQSNDRKLKVQENDRQVQNGALHSPGRTQNEIPIHELIFTFWNILKYQQDTIKKLKLVYVTYLTYKCNSNVTEHVAY